MKIRHTLTYIALAGVLALAGCTASDNEPDTTGNSYQPLFSGAVEGFGNSWHGSGAAHPDTLCIYAVKADRNTIVASRNYIPDESAGQSRFTEENGQPFSLRENEQYQFYTYRTGMTAPLRGTEGIGVMLSSIQIQKKGDDSTHIRQYDFIYAKAETNQKQIDFRYKHAFALLEFELPAGVKAVTLQADDPGEEYAGDRSFSLKSGGWNSTLSGYPSVNLMLEQPTENDNEKAWIIIYPGHENKPFDLIIQTDDYKIYRIPHTPPAGGYRAGQTYPHKVNLQDARLTLEPPARNGKSWQIANARDLQWFRDNVNSGATDLDATLTADIDLQGDTRNTWWPIGVNGAYTGHFDGNGHRISRLCITHIKNESGLWAELDAPGCIENLELTGEITAGDGAFAGGIAAYLYGGTIRKCHSAVNITVNNAPTAGGIAGSSEGTISDCYYDGQIRITGGYTTVGTILGMNGGRVENCYTTGALAYASTIAGGICGGNDTAGEIRNCAALCRDWRDTGDIRSTIIGRITGFNKGQSHNNIARSDLNIGNSFTGDPSLQGISKSWDECLSYRLYTDELGWSLQTWHFTENTLPTLNILK